MDLVFSDVDSLSEGSSSEDYDDIESLYGGKASSILSSLEETIGKIDDLLLSERTYVHGEIVSLVSDPLGQMGKVVDVDISVDLENIYGTKIHNVSSKSLQKIYSLSVGDYVVKGSWLGKVEKVLGKITVLFDDGTKSEFCMAGLEKIVSISADLLEDSQYPPFYPGQRVEVNSSSHLTNSASWLCGIRNGNQNQGTICNVDAGLVHVDWLGRADMSGEKCQPPPCLQDSKDLILLSCFPHANWQLGDWCIVNQDQDAFRCGRSVKVHKQSGRVFSENDHSPKVQEVAVIVRTRTKVDVLWQDGSKSFGLGSSSLFPANIVDVHDFWPDGFVLEKSDDSRVSSVQRWGVVKHVDSKERTVKVKWCSSAENKQPSSEKKEIEEIVSAYELIEHPDYSYSLGDAVFKSGLADLEDLKAKNMYLSNLSSHIGSVVGFNDGTIEVNWVCGSTSKEKPYEIYRIIRCEGIADTSMLDDGNVQQSSVEISPGENQLGREGKDNRDNFKDIGPFSLSQVASGVFTSIRSGFFGSLCTSLIGSYKRIAEDAEGPEVPIENEVALELCDLQTGSQSQLVEVACKRPDIEQRAEEGDKDTRFPLGPNSFRPFDMVNDCSDHHFFAKSGALSQTPQVKRSWLKKIHQEWSILQKDLPETIFVRVYEERVDLLRAAIIGAPGTPYHDNLFVFDIYLPPDYPNEPPMVHYNSGGLRINPNLYESGKVCLSLLNTWKGTGTEVWNAGTSTILQVLLSIQALVLNDQPYFNEAGYDSQIGKAEGEKNSVSYNENAFLVSCKSMLYTLRKPPKHFEVLVYEHFNQRCSHILSACKAYMEGAPIGYPFSSGETGLENQKRSSTSTGFKIMLGKLMPRLVEAFSDKGIDCGHM